MTGPTYPRKELRILAALAHVGLMMSRVPAGLFPQCMRLPQHNQDNLPRDLAPLPCRPEEACGVRWLIRSSIGFVSCRAWQGNVEFGRRNVERRTNGQVWGLQLLGSLTAVNTEEGTCIRQARHVWTSPDACSAPPPANLQHRETLNPGQSNNRAKFGIRYHASTKSHHHVRDPSTSPAVGA